MDLTPITDDAGHVVLCRDVDLPSLLPILAHLVIHDARVPYLGRSSGAGLDVDRTSCTLLTMLLVHHQYLGIRALVP
jgi:hypothetical protein